MTMKSVWEKIIELFQQCFMYRRPILIYMNKLKVVHDEPKIQIFAVQQVNRVYSVCALVWIAGYFTSACRNKFTKKETFCACVCIYIRQILTGKRFSIWQKVIKAMQSTELHTPTSSSSFIVLRYTWRKWEGEREWGKICESASASV